MLDGQFPDVAAALRATREDLLAFSAFPLEHWPQAVEHEPARAPAPGDQAPLRRGRRVPNDAAIDRLVTAVIVEQHDEWQVTERRYVSETSMARLRQTPTELPAPS